MHRYPRWQERQFSQNGWAGTVFDLILTPLNFTAARALPELPEFLATAAPRRSDRHRASDLLAVTLSSPGGQPLSPDLLKEAFQLLSSTYFRAGGTVTSAVKDAVEALNENLLSRSERAPVIICWSLPSCPCGKILTVTSPLVRSATFSAKYTARFCWRSVAGAA